MMSFFLKNIIFLILIFLLQTSSFANQLDPKLGFYVKNFIKPNGKLNYKETNKFYLGLLKCDEDSYAPYVVPVQKDERPMQLKYFIIRNQLSDKEIFPYHTKLIERNDLDNLAPHCIIKLHNTSDSCSEVGHRLVISQHNKVPFIKYSTEHWWKGDFALNPELIKNKEFHQFNYLLVKQKNNSDAHGYQLKYRDVEYKNDLNQCFANLKKSIEQIEVGGINEEMPSLLINFKPFIPASNKSEEINKKSDVSEDEITLKPPIKNNNDKSIKVSPSGNNKNSKFLKTSNDKNLKKIKMINWYVLKKNGNIIKEGDKENLDTPLNDLQGSILFIFENEKGNFRGQFIINLNEIKKEQNTLKDLIEYRIWKKKSNKEIIIAGVGDTPITIIGKPDLNTIFIIPRGLNIPKLPEDSGNASLYFID